MSCVLIDEKMADSLPSMGLGMAVVEKDLLDRDQDRSDRKFVAGQLLPTKLGAAD